jgi:DNA-binding FrmR family transcriptional regulator
MTKKSRGRRDNAETMAIWSKFDGHVIEITVGLQKGQPVADILRDIDSAREALNALEQRLKAKPTLKALK